MLRKLPYILGIVSAITLFGWSFLPEPTPYVFPETKRFLPMPVATDNPTTVEGVELGRYLFYDPILSRDSSVSCASCHQQKFAFTDGFKQFSQGIDGQMQKRNTLPLFNLAWYPSLFWDGRAQSLETQVFQPVSAHNEMDLSWAVAEKRMQAHERYGSMFNRAFPDQPIDSVHIAKAIAQFERTLISNDAKYDRVLKRKAYFTKEEYEGFVLMNDQTKGDCLHCHTTDADPMGTTFEFSNNGLDPATSPSDYRDAGLAKTTNEPTDAGKFKIPSLRNVGFTAPYMHDGRFETLEDVLRFYSEEVNPSLNVDSKMGTAHHGGAHLSCEEQEKIIAFLHTLSDSSFTSNPAFASPF